MSNPLDTDAGSELFSTYEAELKLVEADVTQKLDQIAEVTGEERKVAIRGAERALDEAKELVWVSYDCPLFSATHSPSARPNEPRKVKHTHLVTVESQLPLSQPPVGH